MKSATESEEESFKKQVSLFLKQLTVGCGNRICSHKLCASNPNSFKIPGDSKKIMAMQLASRMNSKALICPNISSESIDSSSVSDSKENSSFLDALLSSGGFKEVFREKEETKSSFGFFNLFNFSRNVPDESTSEGSSSWPASRTGSRAGDPLSLDLLEELLSEVETTDGTRDLKLQNLCSLIRNCFSDVDSLSNSFLASLDGHQFSSEDNVLLGVDLNQVRRMYLLIFPTESSYMSSVELDSIQNAVNSSLELFLTKVDSKARKWELDYFDEKFLIHSLKSKTFMLQTHNIDTTLLKFLRAIFIAIEHPYMESALEYEAIWKKIAIIIANLRRNVKRFLSIHVARAYMRNPSAFKKLVLQFRKIFCERFNPSLVYSRINDSSTSNRSTEDGIISTIRVLSFLYNVNETAGKIRHEEISTEFIVYFEGFPLRTIIPFWYFYTTCHPYFGSQVDEEDSFPILKNVPLKQLYFDYMNNQVNGSSNYFSLLSFPFLLDPILKIRLVKIESISWMSSEFEEAFVRQGFLGTLKRVVEGVQNSQVTDNTQTNENLTSITSSSSQESNPSRPQMPSTYFVTDVHEIPNLAEDTIENIESLFSLSTNPYFVLEVDRTRLIKSTFEQIQSKWTQIHKPLKIRFHNEEGLDQGGVQKEFFQLIFAEILDPGFGLFTYDEQVRLSWLNSSTEGRESDYLYVGALLGLSIYNGVLLDVHFPLVFYKKLLLELDLDSSSDWSKCLKEGTLRGDNFEESVTLDDLGQLYPEIANSLRQLLLWDSKDGGISDVFCRMFEISYNRNNQIETYPLVKGGSDIDVTEENRELFVTLFTHHKLVDYLRPLFSPISEGFWRVFGGPSFLKHSVINEGKVSKKEGVLGSCISTFRPDELQFVVTGLSSNSSNCYSGDSFTALKSSAKYEDYSESSEIICWFWDLVLNEFTDSQRKKLLWFVTASDRIPLGGISTIEFVIQRNGSDNDRLPTALTCFARLLLPEYSSKKKLKRLLELSIDESKGFGLI